MSCEALPENEVLKAVVEWYGRRPNAVAWGKQPNHWLLLEEYPDSDGEYIRQWVRVDPAKTFFAGTVTADAMNAGIIQTVERDGAIDYLTWLEDPVKEWCEKNDPCVSVAADPEIRTKFLPLAAVRKKLAGWYGTQHLIDVNEIGLKWDDWEQISTWNPAPGYKHREFVRSKVVVGSGVVCSTENPDGSMYFEWQIPPKNNYAFEPEPKRETPKPESWGEFA